MANALIGQSGLRHQEEAGEVAEADVKLAIRQLRQLLAANSIPEAKIFKQHCAVCHWNAWSW